MAQKILSKLWWENRLKYQPLAQRFFLLLRLSCKFPATLNIEPTNFCNLDCLFCPVARTNRPKGFIDLKLYQRVVDQIGRLKVLWLNKDGEPLLHPKIDRLVEYAKKKKVADRLEMYSNGVLLNEAIASRLIKAGLDSLVISLDAVDSQSFKKLKRKDAYDQVASNIRNFLKLRKKLKSLGPLLSVKMVDMGKPEDLRKFKKQWQGIADCVIVQKLHSWEGSISVEVDELSIRNKKEVKTPRGWPDGLPRGGKTKKKRYPCNLPWLAPAVNWDGTVVPCCVNYRKNELIMGDLKKQSLAEIWHSDKFKTLRQAHLDLDFSQYPTCRRCTFWRQLPNMELTLKLKSQMSKPQF